MVELLSPAGEYNSFLGAINAGADAVYLAGNMYGARASAVNFETDELIKAIKYAHLSDRKVYLTVNTLTKNDELEKLYDFLYPFYINGLDGVIVQDIGVFLYIREVFKDLDIHVSTQAAVTSLYGAEFYKNLGAKRIVLARELTLDEIKKITEKGIETECFIHGAMCYSYSGMCLFSSFLGGNSGNRGRCKGPCRQPYKVNGKEAYYLSLSDMNTLEIIDKLIDANIYSFKIEGRLKSPSYSAGVTGIYRKYIDFCLENPGVSPVISKEDSDLLKILYSRTSTGRGYYERVNSKKMITFEKGAYAKVDEESEKKIVEKYIENPVRIKVDFEFEALSQNKAELKAFLHDNHLISSVAQSLQIVQKAEKLPSGEEEIKNQLVKLGNTFFVCEKCDIKIDDGFVPVGLIKSLRREAIEKLEENILLYKNQRKKDCNKFDFDGDFKEIQNFGSCDITDNSDKALKEIGKPDLKEIKSLLDFNVKCSSQKPFKRAFVKKFDQFEFVLNSSFFDSAVVSKEIIENSGFLNTLSHVSKDIYIELPPVLRSLNEEYFKKTINFAKDNKNIKGLYVNQYDALYLIKSMNFDKEILSDQNIYSYNDLSAAFNQNNFDVLTNPAELSLANYPSFEKEHFSVIFYGRAALMITANCVLKNCDRCSKKNQSDKYSFVDLKDRTGTDFKLYAICDDSLCFNVIYNSKATSLHKYYDKLKNLGINKFLFVFTDENIEEMYKITDDLTEVFDSFKNNVGYDYTAYHFKNGIL
ncbi:MAG: U32 family peptidase [Lachnospiraceae bacterium]|nr:U32 family peptidase [Lachnospiraceae bacterium]